MLLEGQTSLFIFSYLCPLAIMKWSVLLHTSSVITLYLILRPKEKIRLIVDSNFGNGPTKIFALSNPFSPGIYHRGKKNGVTQTVNLFLLHSFGHALVSYYNLTYHSPPTLRPLYVLWNSFSGKFCYPLGSAHSIFGKDQTFFSDLLTH